MALPLIHLSLTVGPPSPDDGGQSTGLREWKIVTANYDAVPGDRLYVIGAITIKLPSAARGIDPVMAADFEGTWDHAPPTFEGNGKLIEFMGATDTSMTLVGGGTVTFVYDDVADRWLV